MIVYRLGMPKWLGSLNGEGPRLLGGRWNHAGIPCIYTSESRALAVLEYTVNTNIEEIPRLLSLATIEIPDSFRDNPIPSLPGDWRDVPGPVSARDYGSALLSAHIHPVLRFPSSVISKEFNYILNPLHTESSSFKVISVEDFIYDVRIKVV